MGRALENAKDKLVAVGRKLEAVATGLVARKNGAPPEKANLRDAHRAHAEMLRHLAGTKRAAGSPNPEAATDPAHAAGHRRLKLARVIPRG